jgi:hypothetical protein
MSANGVVALKLVLRAFPVWRVWACSTVRLYDHFGLSVEPDDDYIDKVVAIARQGTSIADMRRRLDGEIPH